MTDLLIRLQLALPLVQTWMSTLLASHSPQYSPVPNTFTRLTQSVPPHVLGPARVVRVPRTPFPPVRNLGLPEFAALEDTPMAAITFGNVFFVSEPHVADEGTYFHELIHTIQWRVLGIRDFLLTYSVGLAQFGYEYSPLECIAFNLQRAFEGNEALGELEQTVTVHAHQSRVAAQTVFAAWNVAWGA